MLCSYCSTAILETNEHQRYRYRKTGKIFCQKKCGMRYRDARRKPRVKSKTQKLREEMKGVVSCTQCGKEADLSGFRLDRYLKTNRAYCGNPCAKKYVSQVSSVTASKTNRRYASARMKEKNPMRHAATRKKVSTTLKKLQFQPSVQGGNGRKPTEAEIVLYEMLGGLGFTLQPVILTQRPKPIGYPPCYKPDLGNPLLKLAIEADGQSHTGQRRLLDKKKDDCLVGLGWTVLRFKNEQILTDTAEVKRMIMYTISRLMGYIPIPPTNS